MAGLFVFLTLFIGVLVFVFWPGNQKGFEEAAAYLWTKTI